MMESFVCGGLDKIPSIDFAAIRISTLLIKIDLLAGLAFERPELAC